MPRLLSSPDTSVDLHLTGADFPDLYQKLMTLEFPIEVSEILDLRSLLNHAIDGYAGPVDPRWLQELHRSHFAASQVTKPAHVERLSRLLAVLYTLNEDHQAYSAAVHAGLRQSIDEVVEAASESRRWGTILLGITTGLSLLWLAFPELQGFKWAALCAGALGADQWHSLVTLGRRRARLTSDLSSLEERRLIEEPDWSAIIHRTAMVLGYGEDSAVAFTLDTEHPVEARRAAY